MSARELRWCEDINNKFTVRRWPFPGSGIFYVNTPFFTAARGPFKTTMTNVTEMEKLSPESQQIQGRPCGGTVRKQVEENRQAGVKTLEPSCEIPPPPPPPRPKIASAGAPATKMAGEATDGSPVAAPKSQARSD